jgi:hypothetical protein
LPVDRSTYRSRRAGQAQQTERIKEIATTRVRYGYRRIHVLLRREGWVVDQSLPHRGAWGLNTTGGPDRQVFGSRISDHTFLKKSRYEEKSKNYGQHGSADILSLRLGSFELEGALKHFRPVGEPIPSAIRASGVSTGCSGMSSPMCWCG